MRRPTQAARRSVSHGSCVAAGPIALGAGSRIEPWELLKHPAFIIILLRKGADASAGQKLQHRIRRLDRTLLGQPMSAIHDGAAGNVRGELFQHGDL